MQKFIDLISECMHFMNNRRYFVMQAVLVFVILNYLLSSFVTVTDLMLMLISVLVKIVVTAMVWVGVALNANSSLGSYFMRIVAKLPKIIAAHFILSMPLGIGLSFTLLNGSNILGSIILLLGLAWFVCLSLLPIILTLEDYSLIQAFAVMKNIAHHNLLPLIIFCIFTFVIPNMIQLALLNSGTPVLLMAIIEAVIAVFMAIFTFRFYYRLS